MRNEREANSMLDHSTPWPLDMWLKNHQPIPVEEPREFAYGRWLLLGAAVIAAGMGAVIWWLTR